jgi:hypothetical protein
LSGGEELSMWVNAAAAQGHGVDLAGAMGSVGVGERRGRDPGRTAETADVAWVGQPSRFATPRKLAGVDLGRG